MIAISGNLDGSIRIESGTTTICIDVHADGTASVTVSANCPPQIPQGVIEFECDAADCKELERLDELKRNDVDTPFVDAPLAPVARGSLCTVGRLERRTRGAFK